MTIAKTPSEEETPSPTQAEADAARLAMERKTEPPLEPAPKKEEEAGSETLDLRKDRRDRRHPESRHLEADKPEGAYQTRNLESS